jgi:hypothetical protein
VASAGDVNGDGISDIVIGVGSSPFGAYVVFGGIMPYLSSYIVDTLLNGTNGFKLTSTSSWFGNSVASAGDVNGDGVSDLVIGAYINTAYIIFGSRASFANPFTVDSLLNGANGFKFTSAGVFDSSLGLSVTSAGDLNADGISDILVGTGSINASYVVFGSRVLHTNPFNADALLNGTNGFKLNSNSLGFGASVAGTGDINGDGISDAIIGTYGANAAYVIYGQSCAIDSVTLSTSITQTLTPPLTHLNITSPGSYAGTPGNDRFIINSYGQVVITGDGGYDTYLIYEKANSSLTITDFNAAHDSLHYVSAAGDSCFDVNNITIVCN